jgi:hypothetical protein
VWICVDLWIEFLFLAVEMGRGEEWYRIRDGELILELKPVSAHKGNYLKITGFAKTLLINFGSYRTSPHLHFCTAKGKYKNFSDGANLHQLGVACMVLQK